MTSDTGKGLALHETEIVRLAGNRVSHAEIGRRIAQRQGRRIAYQGSSIAGFLRILKRRHKAEGAATPEPAP